MSSCDRISLSQKEPQDGQDAWKENRRLDNMQRMRQHASDLIGASGAVGSVRNGLHSMPDIVTTLWQRTANIQIQSN